MQTSGNDDLAGEAWCPASDTCIPAADIRELGVPDYALAQSALPTEFAIQGFAVEGVEPEAFGISIHPKASPELPDFELIERNARQGFDRVKYSGKFGNLTTWRAMVGGRVREGGDFFSGEGIKFFCVEAGRCLVLIHHGRFEAQFDVAEDEVSALPAIKDRWMQIFEGWKVV